MSRGWRRAVRAGPGLGAGRGGAGGDGAPGAAALPPQLRAPSAAAGWRRAGGPAERSPAFVIAGAKAALCAWLRVAAAAALRGWEAAVKVPAEN